ncbi:MAG: T9SS type A sorting domain-containing protein, partial [Candidatus Saccharibacteria bacterium]
AKIDKISIAREDFIPSASDDVAKNLCSPYLTSIEENLSESNEYALDANYPNPFTGKTNISFEIPVDAYVSLKVYNAYGAEIAELAGTEFIKGKHIVTFDGKELAEGMYFYTLKVNKFSAGRIMLIQGK